MMYSINEWLPLLSLLLSDMRIGSGGVEVCLHGLMSELEAKCKVFEAVLDAFLLAFVEMGV